MSENEFEPIAVENDAPVIPPAIPEEEKEEPVDMAADMHEEIDALKKELTLAQIKTALLLSGILREKLDEGAALALGLCGAGKTPDEAAAEVTASYPHLKAIQREIPQFAAGGSGSADGFSAIRRIFSGR